MANLVVFEAISKNQDKGILDWLMPLFRYTRLEKVL